MSDVTSTGVALTGYGKTCRKDVLGGVLVPVVRVPQAGHVQWRVPRLKPVSGCPHAEQVFEDGYQRSITIR